MPEINQLADERLSSQVSEVIIKYDLLADKMDTDITQQSQAAVTASTNAAQSAIQALTLATESAQSAQQARTSLTTLENKIASGVFKGDKGDKGDVGPIGATGGQGIQGIQGLKGATGERGVQGIQGIQGAQGVQGPKGDKGDKGNTGDRGATGPQGPQGIQGPQGLAATQRAEARYELFANTPQYYAYAPAGGTWAYITPAHENVQLPGGVGGNMSEATSGIVAGGTRIGGLYKTAEAVNATCWRLM